MKSTLPPHAIQPAADGHAPPWLNIGTADDSIAEYPTPAETKGGYVFDLRETFTRLSRRRAGGITC